jgi:DNA helicase HerA-like ATPase
MKMMKKRDFFRSPKMHLALDELATVYHLPNKDLEVIPNIAWGKNLLGEPPENLPIITRDTNPEEKIHTNVFAETTYKNKAVKYGLKRADRRRHMYVIGKTGTGKSTLLANMAINDLKNNEGMCVIDPHGDLVETLLNYIPSRRINDVIYFDPSDPERTVQINLFEGKNVVHRELIASGIISIFQKLYGYSWGPRLEYILRNALLTLLTSDNARLSDILELLTNKSFRDKYVENLEDPILKSFWVDEYNKMQDRLRTESIASILNKVGQFTSSPLIRNVVNAHKSSFNIEDIMNEGKILLVNLSQGKLGEDNATLLGAMMITKIQLAAMTRVHIEEEKRKDFYLYVDEFQNFATDAFIKILSEARKYRLSLTLANQYIAQIPEEVQKAIFGNCGSVASFVMGSEDAEVFSKEYGEHYTPDELVSLEKHQIINRISIDNVLSKPFPARTLSLAKSSNMNKDKVIKVSKERYAKKRN